MHVSCNNRLAQNETGGAKENQNITFSIPTFLKLPVGQVNLCTNLKFRHHLSTGCIRHYRETSAWD